MPGWRSPPVKSQDPRPSPSVAAAEDEPSWLVQFDRLAVAATQKRAHSRPAHEDNSLGASRVFFLLAVPDLGPREGECGPVHARLWPMANVGVGKSTHAQRWVDDRPSKDWDFPAQVGATYSCFVLSKRVLRR